ncbi:nuclear transport factor 2 family protein, partial [Mesorhizobium sp. M4A.F.Ca.ET.029.04.2.1]
YDFPNNDMLMHETFSVAGNRITASTQAAIAESCEAY